MIRAKQADEAASAKNIQSLTNRRHVGDYRHTWMLVCAGLLLAWVLLSSCAHTSAVEKAAELAGGSQATVIYIVRHAEKLPDKDDPELSAAGRQRAQALAVLLRHESVDALYSSNYRRTVQTLTPLSTTKTLEIQRYDAGDSAALVRKVLAGNVGQRIVIAGHSNTVPEIVCLFEAANEETCADVAWLGDDDYDRIFVVLHNDNSVEVIELSY